MSASTKHMAHYFEPEKAGQVVINDLMKLLLGRELGRGASRVVYAHASDPTLVVKIEQEHKCFSNIIEWIIWDELRQTKAKKWLAPCVEISSCGCALIQKRTMLVEKHELPKEVPSWMADLKLKNWGRIGKNVVCHDYSCTNIGTHLVSSKTVKARFHDYSSYSK